MSLLTIFCLGSIFTAVVLVLYEGLRFAALSIQAIRQYFYRWRLFREQAGVIAPGRAWVCIDPEGYIYIADSLPGCLWSVLRYWRADSHLAG